MNDRRHFIQFFSCQGHGLCERTKKTNLDRKQNCPLKPPNVPIWALVYICAAHLVQMSHRFVELLRQDFEKRIAKFQHCFQSLFSGERGHACLVILPDARNGEVKFLRWHWGLVKGRGFIFNTWCTI